MMLPVEEAHVDIRSSISISISSIARIEMVVGGSRMDIPVESKDEVVGRIANGGSRGGEVSGGGGGGGGDDDDGGDGGDTSSH
uniref:Uncharacterized protein n=1 Tax=Vespula pensylvanica TaxID=30213 RepID=A0A834JKZ7_VESPE|nr:hypothetical protein H0235_017650 [Vespula pensylvanica]